MSPDAKPVPIPDHDTQPFWDACKEHELRAQRCTSCGRFRWPPRAFCPACYSWEYAWTRLSGRGTVYSFSVVHHVVVPAFGGDAPYVVALVTLEGTGDEVRLLSNIIGCSWEAVQVGMLLQVEFEDASADVTLPKFRPASPRP